MKDRFENREPGTADFVSDADERLQDAEDQDRRIEREVDLRESTVRADDHEGMRLLPDDIVEDLRPRWADIQASFVDEPRRAVQKADALVADAIRRLAEAFADARADLERDWDRGEDVSTEDLRVAFRRYRTFFDRLLDI